MTVSSVIQEEEETKAEEKEESKTDVVFLDNISALDDSPTTVTGDSSASHSRPPSVMVSVDCSLLRLAIAEKDDDSEEGTGTADLYLGSCCDLRRACIVGNIVFILLTLLAVALTIERYLILRTIDFSELDDDDEQYDEKSSLAQEEGFFVTVFIKNCLGVSFAAIGIIGAARFHKILLFCAAIGFCIDMVMSAFTRRWSGVILAGFMIHVHSALFLSLRSGRTTRENYTKACCGVETRT